MKKIILSAALPTGKVDTYKQQVADFFGVTSADVLLLPPGATVQIVEAEAKKREAPAVTEGAGVSTQSTTSSRGSKS